MSDWLTDVELPLPLVALNAALLLLVVVRVYLLGLAMRSGSSCAAANSSKSGEQGHSSAVDPLTHLRSLPPLPLAPDLQKSVNQLRRFVSAGMALSSAERAVLDDDAWCCRFLIARNWDVPKAAEMMSRAMQWRVSRKPIAPLSDGGTAAARLLEHESATGKVWCAPGLDRHGRCVVIFDNSVQNTADQRNQMLLLAFTLEFALRHATADVDKICLVIKLQNFSLLNSPPWATTRETLQILTGCFPETLGHAIAYRPPSIFQSLWRVAGPLLDRKTHSKVAFVTGSSEPGGANDRLMNEVIGANWREMTGCELPVRSPGCTSGFEPREYWDSILARDREYTLGSRAG